ncbi:MAG: xanthine dehydrogenase family protein molybdopterin-binding subunit [Gemmatimonadales bacterium]|nr:xanthine dehydrogenase family protein molybdopterin-binding subunit [Gemmatimonadales bacterium]
MTAILSRPTYVGQPRTRADGKPKVTGGAQYAADTPVEGLLFGVLVGATIASGRVKRLNTKEAARAPGVIRVLTHANMPRLGKVQAPPAGESRHPLQDEEIRYEGQYIALVVARTLEQARYGAALVRAEYAPAAAATDFLQLRTQAFTATNWAEPDSSVGDIESGLARGEIRVDQVYRTADRHHNAMEPSATVAEWRKGTLTIHDATQGVQFVRQVVSQALGLPPQKVRVRSPFLGGGFGCKGYVWPHQILTAAAARELGRPLKVVLTRAQDFVGHGYQPATEQRLEIGATRDGRLTGIRHTSLNPTSVADSHVEYAALTSRTLYACPAIHTRHQVVRVHRSTPTPMRAPHEGPSNVGLEIAMDELAYASGVDPVELRLRNYAETDPTTGKPFSAKGLRACYAKGAERFGWSRRTPAPRSMRKGGTLVGWGMASALMPTFRVPAAARITFEPAGTVLIESSTQEIGTGVYTIMPQIAADVLEIAPDRIRLVLGDTTLPEAAMTAGSSTTMAVGSAVQAAAANLKRRIGELAGGSVPPPGEWPDLLRREGLERLAAEGTWGPGANASPTGEDPEWAMYTFGAISSTSAAIWGMMV